MKERPFVFTVTRCLWIWLEANNRTSSNIHWNHQWYWSYFLTAHNTLNGTTDVSIVYLMRAHLSWKKPLISSHTVTQPHTRSLAMRTTWMIQIACLARLYSRTLLHTMYLVFVLYKDVKSCAFRWCTRTTRVHTRLGWSCFEPSLVLYPWASTVLC